MGISDVAKKAYVSEVQVRAVLEAIKDLASTGEKVCIHKYGVFAMHTRKARVGRNPKTGEPILVAAKQVFMFSAAKPKKTKEAA